MPVDLPLGEELDWKPVPRPTRVSLAGAHILARPVNAESDAVQLFSVSHPPDGDPAIWTYPPDGPYESPDHLRQTLAWAETSENPLYFTLVRPDDRRPLGLASYLRITPELGVIEIGHIWFGVPLQRTTAATEAIYLLVRHAFDDRGIAALSGSATRSMPPRGVRPSASGSPSRASFASTRSSRAVNRGTAWYAITDEEWPAIWHGFEMWLAPENMDDEGRQRRSLRDLIGEARR